MSVEEVVRRGVERIRPANQKGEELRDVILWLLVLEYARKSRGKVAFISDDGTFRSPKGDLHETLASDVAKIGAEVSFYGGIAEFIAGNSLHTEALTERSFFSLVSADSIEKGAKKSFEESRIFGRTVEKIEIDAIRFSSGNRYKVAEDSFYVESVLTGTARVMVREVQFVSTQFATTFQPFGQVTNIASDVFGENVHWAANTAFREGPGHLEASISQPAVIKTSPGIEFANAALFQQGFAQTTPSLKLEYVEKLYRCRFELGVSARIEAGKLIALQTDGLRVAEMESVPDLGSPDLDLPKAE